MMANLLSELCEKEIVNMKDGAILGRIGDLEIDASTACIKAMIVPGRLKCFGILGREENVVIPWDKIEIIGCDTILVCIEPGYNRRKRRRLLEMFKR